MQPTFFSLRRAQLCVQSLLWYEFEEWELLDHVTPVQLDVLRIVYERITVMRWQLIDLLGVKGPAVSRMLERLEKRGLIEKMKWDVDARYVEVKLTEYGEWVVKWALEGLFSEGKNAARALSRSEPPEADLAELDRLLLAARIRMGDGAKFVHPWMRVVMNMGWNLANPPPPDQIFPPRDD